MLRYKSEIKKKKKKRGVSHPRMKRREVIAWEE
jgi:hypothetical protein